VDVESQEKITELTQQLTGLTSTVSKLAGHVQAMTAVTSEALSEASRCRQDRLACLAAMERLTDVLWSSVPAEVYDQVCGRFLDATRAGNSAGLERWLALLEAAGRARTDSRADGSEKGPKPRTGKHRERNEDADGRDYDANDWRDQI
jgi:outer membrane murein-binding lipoprotein Lpp